MISTAPQIGFDRFIDLHWVGAALDVRAGDRSLEDLAEILDAAGLSLAAKKKTRTVLNRLWLEPRPELQDFASRGVEMYKSNSKIDASTLSWGMAIACYPFFGRVAEFVGRLTALQGDCSASEVHRRMSEVYGEREGTYRMTNMVLQSQASWGAIRRVEGGRRLVRSPKRVLDEDRVMVWLIEAAVRYAGKPISTITLPSTPVLYPFALDHHLTYAISSSAALELRSEGANQHFVTLQGVG